MTQPRPYYFMVTFWGAKYQDFFYSMCLPTMLAPNNLPVLKDRPGSKFIICTTEADWAALSRRPLFQELKKYVEPFLIAIPPPTKDDLPQLYMSYGHRLAMKKAYDDKAIAGFLAPDLFVSDGMVARTVELIEQGKKAILCPALRYAMEPAMERLAADHRLVPDVPISLSPEYLSAIAVNSLHSELQRYDFEGPYFDDYPIWSFWRVPRRNGLVLYTVSWALLLGDYTAIPTFDDEFLEHSTIDGFFVHRNFGHLLEKGELTYLNDSHDVVFMSLTSETELTYLPLQRISMNDYKLGWIKRIADIKKFHQSDVLDPFRRRAYQVPIVIRADALDEEYRRTIESSRRLIKIAVRTPYQVLAGPRYMLRYLPPLWEARQRFLQQVRQVKSRKPGENLRFALGYCSLPLQWIWYYIKRPWLIVHALLRFIFRLVNRLLIAPIFAIALALAGGRRSNADIIDKFLIIPIVEQRGWSGAKAVIRWLPKPFVRSIIYRARIKGRYVPKRRIKSARRPEEFVAKG